MMEANKIYTGDCIKILKTFPDNSVDSCVTDPPYGIGFMGKAWDTFKYDYLEKKQQAENKRRPRTDGRTHTGFGNSAYAGLYDLSHSGNLKYQQWYYEVMLEVFRVLKPGGHILSACGTRTYHRMACAIEDAGFEIRDVITWHYGSGFPKSMDISKAIDKQAGAERKVVDTIKKTHISNSNTNEGYKRPSHLNEDGSDKTTMNITIPATDAAKQWDGWGTALKPACEFWTLARKPLSENTIAQNVLKHGTGGLNIDACRIETDDLKVQKQKGSNGTEGLLGEYNTDGIYTPNLNGRFPANLILDEEAAKLLDQQSGVSESKQSFRGIDLTDSNVYGKGDCNYDTIRGHNDTGGASRFFYCAKSSQEERNKGLDKRQQRKVNDGRDKEIDNPFQRRSTLRQNTHPTVKPISLMRWLVKLITPKYGIVLDPFAGSGTTCIGAKLELINYIGIELDKENCEIAEARIAAWNPDKYIEQELFW